MAQQALASAAGERDTGPARARFGGVPASASRLLTILTRVGMVVRAASSALNPTARPLEPAEAKQGPLIARAGRRLRKEARHERPADPRPDALVPRAPVPGPDGGA